MCSICPIFVSVFEPVDEEKLAAQRRLSNLKAVLKYRSKYSEQYKQANLADVQKYHAKDPKAYKQAHLTAVQKYNQKHEFPPHPPS